MKDVPVLSIDVSKSKSYATMFRSYGDMYLKPFPFNHCPTDLDYLTSQLVLLEQETGKKPSIVMEATGNYSKPISSFFRENGYNVFVINPLQTHAQKKKSVRKVKTDPIDTNRIAQVFYLDDSPLEYCYEPHILELRNLCRQYESFNNLYTETQNKYRAILDLCFPKFELVFSHMRSPTALNILSLFSSPADLLAASRSELLESLKPARKSRDWNEMKVDQLIMAAKESLPFNQAQQSSVRVLRSYIDLLLSQQKILADLRAQMIYWANLSPYYALLYSIPGVGEITATTILAEIGDIERFPSSKQLVAFAGLDPSVFESGNFKASKNRISKRGSSYLRKALYQATVAGISNRQGGPLNKILYAFYSKKLAEGKPPKAAIIATSNKLVRMIYGILSSGKPYSLNQ